MDIKKVIADLAKAIQQSSNTKAIFGDPQQLEKKTIIPVAEVNISLGGGGTGTGSLAVPGDF